jgi:aminoglycoside phosphotransferase (APT) family kinase protein
LQRLIEQGIAVSRPLGWGSDADGHPVLLTSFDGKPIQKANAPKGSVLARLLASVHQVPVQERDLPRIPEYGFTDYFFPGIQEHPDIKETLDSILMETSIRQDAVIHGDFHLGNIVEENARYAVIDWTNGQLGDSRYDFAWSLTLLRIYISGRYADSFQKAYLHELEITPRELERYEALACLRWFVLYRRGGVPVDSNTKGRVQSLIRDNIWLKGRVKA